VGASLLPLGEIVANSLGGGSSSGAWDEGLSPGKRLKEGFFE
jgi:hypothetical protein